MAPGDQNQEASLTELEARAYLDERRISTYEDFRSPVEIALLHMQTGSTALRNEIDSNLSVPKGLVITDV